MEVGFHDTEEGEEGPVTEDQWLADLTQIWNAMSAHFTLVKPTHVAMPKLKELKKCNPLCSQKEDQKYWWAALMPISLPWWMISNQGSTGVAAKSYWKT